MTATFFFDELVKIADVRKDDTKAKLKALVPVAIVGGLGGGLSKGLIEKVVEEPAQAYLKRRIPGIEASTKLRHRLLRGLPTGVGRGVAGAVTTLATGLLLLKAIEKTRKH